MIKFLKLLIAVIIVVPFFILSYVPLFLAFVLKKCGKKNASEAILNVSAHFLIKLIFLMLGGRVKVKGLENIPTEGRICFIGNHTPFWTVSPSCIPERSLPDSSARSRLRRFRW